MFNNTPNWTPYKIPPTPTITNDDVYSLTCSNGAVSSRNPSPFLQWRKVGLPEGDNKGDLLYWDPAAGDDGAWVVLPAPSGSDISIKEFDVCENGEPKKYNMLVWSVD
jgi:hypothetical protein